MRRGYPALGEFEQMVLLAILRLEGKAYAPAVLEEIEARTGRAPSRGSIYVTLDRLEEKGLLASVMEASGTGRGGRRRRRLRLTGAGVAALRESREALLRMWQGMEERLGTLGRA